jgi:hypothetical protein
MTPQRLEALARLRAVPRFVPKAPKPRATPSVAVKPAPKTKPAPKAKPAPAQAKPAPKPFTILTAMDSDELFARAFAGPSWSNWRVYLKALFALEMSAADLAVYREHTGRLHAPIVPFVESALVVGRRGGKSRILATIAVYLACFKNYDQFLAPGEIATAAVLAASRDQARTILRYVTGLIKSVPALAAMVIGETETSITLSNRVAIEITTASFRVTRGYTFCAVLADETAFWRSDEMAANPDQEIFKAIRPGLATIPGAILLNASSPYRRAGVLWTAFTKHFGRDDAKTLVWKGPTAAMNPSIDPAIIAEAYQDDEESAKAEYGAEFRSDVGEFVARDVVEAATEWGLHERPPSHAVAGEYAAFIDAAGGSGLDSMTMGIAHLDGDIAVLDFVVERKPPFSPDDTVADFSATLASYGISHATSDRFGGDWVVESFRKRGITVSPTARPKSDIYRELLPILNAGRVRLLDVPRLTNQLCGLERRTARGGRDSIDHAPGGHDDVANAVAGAVVSAISEQRPSLMRASDLLQDGAPVNAPFFCDGLLVTTNIDARGGFAIAYWAVTREHEGRRYPRLVLLDFDDDPLSGETYAGVQHRLEELGRATLARLGTIALFAPEAICGQFERIGLAATALPREFANPINMLVAASVHVRGGDVKLSTAAHERATTTGLGGALTFRVSDSLEESALRTALVVGIVAALEAVDYLAPAYA